MKKHEIEYKGEKYELSDEQYEELKTAIELIEKANRTKFSEINSDDLVDIKSVNMDQDLSKLENVVKFINEVKNPYYFKVGKVKVRVSYADTDRTLDDAFANLLRIKFM
jgi:cell division protein ZapA (FtsZ GTPase activity inhibitor)